MGQTFSGTPNCSHRSFRFLDIIISSFLSEGTPSLGVAGFPALLVLPSCPSHGGSLPLSTTAVLATVAVQGSPEVFAVLSSPGLLKGGKIKALTFDQFKENASVVMTLGS